MPCPSVKSITVIESDLQEDIVIVHTGDTPSPFICDRTPDAKLEMSFKTPPGKGHDYAYVHFPFVPIKRIKI